MTTQVDPYLFRIPDRFLRDPELREFFEYLQDFLFKLWTRTGGSTDAVSNQETRELYPWGQIATANIPNLADFEVVYVTGATHTTVGNEIVVCNNTSKTTITLNASPDEKEQAIVIRANVGEVDVTASSLINGETTKSIIRRYTAPRHFYLSELATWVTI